MNMMVWLKLSNLVSLAFLGFALFLYFHNHQPTSPHQNMATDSIYDFTVKVFLPC